MTEKEAYKHLFRFCWDEIANRLTAHGAICAIDAFKHVIAYQSDETPGMYRRLGVKLLNSDVLPKEIFLEKVKRRAEQENLNIEKQLALFSEVWDILTY